MKLQTISIFMQYEQIPVKFLDNESTHNYRIPLCLSQITKNKNRLIFSFQDDATSLCQKTSSEDFF